MPRNTDKTAHPYTPGGSGACTACGGGPESWLHIATNVAVDPGVFKKLKVIAAVDDDTVGNVVHRALVSYIADRCTNANFPTILAGLRDEHLDMVDAINALASDRSADTET